MFWHLILVLFSPVYLMFALLFRDDRARLVVALYQQVLVLQRQLGRRPSLVKGERLALVLSGLLVGKKKLTEVLMIVKPETLVGWHRAIVRRHWRLVSRRKPGRPSEITPGMEQMVPQIAGEDRWMGYGKIAGEMRKLGFSRFGRSSVKRILKQHGLTPESRQSAGLGCLQFFRHYGRFTWASDYLTVTTATLRTYYVIFFLEIATRRICCAFRRKRPRVPVETGRPFRLKAAGPLDRSEATTRGRSLGPRHTAGGQVYCTCCTCCTCSYKSMMRMFRAQKDENWRENVYHSDERKD